MNVHLDPVWPWSRLWEIGRELPLPLLVLGALVGLFGLAVPLILARGRGATLYGALAALAAPLVLLAWHAWPFALSDARDATGYGAMAVPVAALWLVGLGLLLLGPAALAGVSLATYATAPGATPGRRRLVAGLRLAAFLLTMLAVARPALRSVQRDQADVAILVLLDRSRSMTIQDEPGKRSRWEHALKQVEACEPLVERLKQQGVEVRWFTFADDLAPWAPPDPAASDGKRTAVGGALRAAYEGRGGDQQLRAVVVISDGGENGSVPALEEARRWRLAPAPVHTFASGNPGTTLKQNDVALTSITTSPTPFVPVKGKLTVKCLIDARGYETAKARVRLFLELPDDRGVLADREVAARDVSLPLTTGNEVVLTADAPSRPGEVKVKVVVETAEKDDFPLNNTIESFVTVSKEGVSVLLVDRQRAFEPQWICDALSEDMRFRVTPVWFRGGRAALPGGRLFSVEDQPFDVIILGDLTLDQLRSLDGQLTEKIEKQVARGAGLMVLGGLVNLGAGRWGDDPHLRALLPVDLVDAGQEERPARVRPTRKGLEAVPYLFKLDDRADVTEAWKKLPPLNGHTRLRLRPTAEDRPGEKGARTTEEVLARAEGAGPDEAGDPLLVMKTYAGVAAPGKPALDLARVLVLAGDTYHWRMRDEEGQRLHHRFWQQAVVWLARQEDAEGSVWVRPDVRRLPVRGEVGFQVGLRGKGGGGELRDGAFTVEVVAPDGTRREVKALSRSATETRGTFPHTRQPGVYQIVVKGEGKDPSGGVVSGQARARVIVYDEDVEMLSAAANPAFLEKVAAAGEGEARRVEDLPTFFARLAEQPADLGREKWELSPDWATRDRSPFLVAFFLTFTALVSLEWGLRRKWGMV